MNVLHCNQNGIKKVIRITMHFEKIMINDYNDYLKNCNR